MAKGTTVKMWRRTMGVLIGLIVVGFGAILFSLIRIQLVNGSELKQAAVDQQLKDTVLTAQRALFMMQIRKYWLPAPRFGK